MTLYESRWMPAGELVHEWEEKEGELHKHLCALEPGWLAEVYDLLLVHGHRTRWGGSSGMSWRPSEPPTARRGAS